MSKIILLNGASSSGKTSVARGIQHCSKTSWLTFGVDTFIEMMPYPSPDKKNAYFSGTPGKNNHGPTVSIETTEKGAKLFGAMADFASLLADDGHDVIVDEVLFTDAQLRLYVEKLKAHTVYFVGIYCDLALMQEREFLRRNRSLGLSNDQAERVHKGTREYDLVVDTSRLSAFEAAQKIIARIESKQEPEGFTNMRSIFAKHA